MIVHDASLGQIHDGEIRYVLLRTDVLMRIVEYLPASTAPLFLTALEKSVSHHASGSFEYYKKSGAGDLESMLKKCGHAAASLGWGRWELSVRGQNAVAVVVENSPFAAGYGRSSVPVCSAICGALQAMFTVHGDRNVAVREVECSSQGAGNCIFHIDRNV